MSLSAKQRFEIFARDSFTCLYCGAKPPNVALQVDHYVAVSRGGTDDAYNLITACETCNQAKRDKDMHYTCSGCPRPMCEGAINGRDHVERGCMCECHVCPICDAGECLGRVHPVHCKAGLEKDHYVS